MATAITPLANITLSSSASTVTFSSISGSYRDLLLVVSANTSVTTDNAFRVNSDSGSNYSTVVMYGTGSSAASSSDSGSYGFVGYSNTTEYAAQITHFMDYSATDKHKTIISRYGPAGNYVIARAARWASTSAITSITLYAGTPGGTTFTSGSTFALYGVSA